MVRQTGHSYDPEVFLEVLPEDGSPTTIRTVTEAVGCAQITANRHFYDLAREGKVDMPAPLRKRGTKRSTTVRRLKEDEEPTLPEGYDDPKEWYDETPTDY